MVSMHRQCGPQLTYRMHHLVSSGTESASSFPSSTQKRVGLWCQSWVATWVEATWHVQACWQTSWSSPLASERWELRKVWYNASIYHRTWHRPLHVMLVFGVICKNTDPTGSLPSLRREVHEQKQKMEDAFSSNIQVREKTSTSGKVSHELISSCRQVCTQKTIL